ncbi:MAG: TaqI-like C-terminal specificity domain-containing protein [Verrucomicrobiota bacterium]
MSDLPTKQSIQSALAGFATEPLASAATALLESLGYRSDKRLALKPNSAEAFTAQFAKDRPLNPATALLADWQSVDFLFQLTDEEVRAAAGGNQQFLFDSKGQYNGAAMESYLFFAIALEKPHYTRTELSGITRAVNHLFPMPVMVLFRHGDTLTLAVINRRLHKLDSAKDVLEKVTLIKDIRFTSPHRAHIEILADLSFDSLRERHDFSNFVTLHAAWQKSLDSSELNKRFFLEVANWYFWALSHVEFPKDAPKQDGKDHISVIRLITRLMFVWFIKEKGLVPDLLFDERKLPQILSGFSPTKTSDKESVFYRAILQNLFFATLNTEMDKRGWTKEEQNFMAHSLYRFRELFQKPADALDLFKNIPFLNGGLFECLDKDLGENAKPRYVRIDGFSRRDDSQAVAPDFLFFGPERDVDLSEDYGDKKFKTVKVRGLIHTLNHYKFTVAENTPIEEEIALDPELSGKVFENLLAAYNPETGATARKQTGSFYTPREIVNYMVDEALIAYLKTKLENALASAHPSGVFQPSPAAQVGVGQLNTPASNPNGVSQASPGLRRDAGRYPGETAPNISPNPEGVADQPTRRQLGQSGSDQLSTESRLRHLFAYNHDPHQFTPQEVVALIAAIDSLKSLDPAVGSGAFPMGILHKLVFILGKLDPDNTKWRERQRQRAIQQTAEAFKIGDKEERQRRLDDINGVFEQNASDYGRKLYLIENCIYGVDIQPIAVQIAKMRFFISLIVDQKIDDSQPNRGVRPLPNLETKFVAANTLIGVNRPGQQFLRNRDMDAKEAELRRVRERHFLATTPKQKAKCREQDEKLRTAIAELLKGDGWDKDTATNLASWNPYDQNAWARFFDAEWMFGITDGFDIVIGNPPYVRIQNIAESEAVLLKRYYSSAIGKFDIYVLFVENAFRLISAKGIICLIHPHRFLTADYGRGIKAFLDKVRGLQWAILFGVDQVFDAATTYTGLFAYSNGNVSFGFKHANTTEFYLAPFTQRPYSASGSHWNLSTENASSSDLIEKLRGQPRKLSDICIGVFQGIVTVGDDIFVFKGKRSGKTFVGWSEAAGKEVELEADIVKPLLKGENIQRYEPLSSDIWIFYPHYQDEFGKTRAYSEKELRARFPKAFDYIKPFKSHLTTKKIQYKTNADLWFSLHRSREMSLFEQPKILTPQLQNHPSFTFDEHRWYPDAGGYSLILKNATQDDYMFLLGVMNSSLLWYFIRSTSNPYNNSYYYFKTKYLEPFSFPVVDKDKQAQIAKLAAKIHESKIIPKRADTAALELEINQRVYALYGLTPEEIKIVEETSK